MKTISNILFVSLLLSTTPGAFAEQIFFDRAGFDFDDGMSYLATGQEGKEINSGIEEERQESQPSTENTTTRTTENTQSTEEKVVPAISSVVRPTSPSLFSHENSSSFEEDNDLGKDEKDAGRPSIFGRNIKTLIVAIAVVQGLFILNKKWHILPQITKFLGSIKPNMAIGSKLSHLIQAKK